MANSKPLSFSPYFTSDLRLADLYEILKNGGRQADGGGGEEDDAAID